MKPQHHNGQQPQWNADEHRQGAGKEAAQHDAHAKETHAREAHAKAEQASRSVMHPESYDPEWRYYHGAWGG